MAAAGTLHAHRVGVRAFRRGEPPAETCHDGLTVTELMAADLSAEIGETVRLPEPSLDEFVPQVAQGTWDPRSLKG